MVYASSSKSSTKIHDVGHGVREWLEILVGVHVQKNEIVTLRNLE